MVQNLQLVEDTILRDDRRHIADRLVIGHKTHAQIFGHHHHHGFLVSAEIVLEKLGLAVEFELVRLDIVLVDRSRHNSIYQVVLQIFTSHNKGSFGQLTGYF